MDGIMQAKLEVFLKSKGWDFSIMDSGLFEVPGDPRTGYIRPTEDGYVTWTSTMESDNKDNLMILKSMKGIQGYLSRKVNQEVQ